MSLTTTVYNQSSAFQELRPSWEELLQVTTSPQVFQTPAFLESWWSTLGSGELHIITFRTASEKLVGIAPLFMHETSEGEKEIAFIGCVNVSDYLDVCIDPSYTSEVYTALAEHLKREQANNQWSSIYLCSLPASSATRSWFLKHFDAGVERQQDVSPTISLPESWDAYLAWLPRKQRHEIRRKFRRLETIEHSFEVLRDETAVQDAFDDFVQLHRASSREKNDFWDEKHLAFFQHLLPAAARSGWIRLYFLNIQGTRVATMLVFEYNKQFFLYNSGFNPTLHAEFSPGMVLIAHTIREAIEAGATTYDFLRGDEEYKFRFGAVSAGVFDLTWKA